MAVVQGVTEFLPVSSSGHIALLSKLLQIDTNLQDVVLLHAGSLLAILLLVFRDALKALKNWKVLTNIVISTLPAMFVGLFLEEHVDRVFSNTDFLPIFFSITAVSLLLASSKTGDKSLETMSVKDAFLIGLFQALAVLPGVSRSGMVLSATLLLGYKNQDAFTYTFLLAIPVLVGASVLKLDEGGLTMNGVLFVSFLSSLFALLILRKLVLVRKLRWFADYCLMVAFLSFLLG